MSTKLSLAESQEAIAATLRQATTEPDKPIAVAVTDDHGDLIAFARMDGTTPLSTRIALAKAVTAALTRSDTLQWATRIRNLGRSAADYAIPGLVAIQGGLLIRRGAEPVGAIGVSGRTSQEDEDLAREGLRGAGLV